MMLLVLHAVTCTEHSIVTKGSTSFALSAPDAQGQPQEVVRDTMKDWQGFFMSVRHSGRCVWWESDR
eukprot:scaffold251748_cov32-Tisochrysis_lutea.AAC.4